MASSRSSKAVHLEVEHDDSADGRGQYENVRCSELRIKGFVLIEGRPCRIVEMSRSKTGKHGSCKIHLVAVDAFTGRKRVTAYTSSDVVQAPVVAKRECRLIRIDDGDCAAGGGGGDSCDDSAAAKAARLIVSEKSGAGAFVRLCPDKALELLEAAREAADNGGGSDVIVTVMTAMGEEAAVAVRRVRDRNK